MLLRFSIGLMVCIASCLCFAQNTWEKEEIEQITEKVDIDVDQALEMLKAKGVTPYDFGRDLLNLGHPDKAKDWYVAMGIKTKDLQYVYGLAWTKWISGDNKGALKDADYILKKKPSPTIQARTLYMAGAVKVDEGDYPLARKYLEQGRKVYADIDKDGGQYLCLSMLAMCAVYEGKLNDVMPLLNKALKYNEKIKAKGKTPYGLGRYHEIVGELWFAKGKYEESLASALESVESYYASNEITFADEVQAKVGLLYLMTGKPKRAFEISRELWERHHDNRDSGRLLAFNSITLMKLSLCGQGIENAQANEMSARSWANAAPGGKALIRLLEWVKDEKKIPCPPWQ